MRKIATTATTTPTTPTTPTTTTLAATLAATTAAPAAPVAAQAAATTPATPATSWQLAGCVVAKPHSPKAGTTQAVVVALCGPGTAGATMAMLTTALAQLPTAQAHPALPLLRFMARKQGYTVVCTNGLVTVSQ